MPTLAAPLDFSKLEGRNVRIHQLSTAPSSPVEGQEYYNTTDHTFYWWNGTAWRSADASSGVGGPPTGAAGGDLSGTYPNPQIAANTIVAGDIANATITDVQVATANKDGAAGVASMRTLGTGAAQAAAGNAAPNAHHATHDAGGSDAMVIDAVAGTGSLRTLGLTGNKAMPGTTTLDAITVPAADVNLNSKKIIGLATPVSGTDGANKAYVDATAQGMDVKASCRVASTGNITITSPGTTIDGVTMSVNDRVLLKSQGAGTENGIYVWNGSAVSMTRSLDADTGGAGGDITPGMFTFVEEGTANADSGWVLTNDGLITIGTTALTFAQFSGAGQITAGAGLSKTGNTLDVNVTTNRTAITADAVDIASTYVGQSSITTLGTIGTGIWQGNAVAVGFGGTGASTTSGARNALGVPTWYTSLGPSSSNATYFIPQTTHQIYPSRAILVQVQVESTGAVILPDVSVAANGDVTITFSVAQATNTIRAILTGLNNAGTGAQP